MANLLTLRTAPGSASLLKLDGAFFAASVVPLLQKRGFTTAADLHVDVDDKELEGLLLGKTAVPLSGSIRASAQVWEELSRAANARDQSRQGSSRDVGGATGLGSTASKEWIRQSSGKRIKGRTKSKSLKIAAPSSSSSSQPLTDPAAFALANLGRLAALVVERLRALGATAAAAVALESGTLVVDGTAIGPLVS
ncbi:MAG: hypothetical protein Q8O67_10235 [Deltaproteobacteria bacterium]|nr:hypothetical protein [Deltaproteobacteria bacterium]